MDHQVLSGISSAKLHKLEVRDANGVFQDILTLVGTGGSGTNNFTSQNWEDTNSTVRVLSPNLFGQLLYNNIMLVDMQVLQQNLANFTQTAQLTSLLAGKVDNSRVLTDVPSSAVFTDTMSTLANTASQ